MQALYGSVSTLRKIDWLLFDVRFIAAKLIDTGSSIILPNPRIRRATLLENSRSRVIWSVSETKAEADPPKTPLHVPTP